MTNSDNAAFAGPVDESQADEAGFNFPGTGTLPTPVRLLAALAVTIPLFDAFQSMTCGETCGAGGSVMRFVLVLAVLVGSGIAFRAALKRFAAGRVLMTAAVLAAFPLTYLLAARPAATQTVDVVTLEQQLAESGAAQAELEAQLALLSAEMAAMSIAADEEEKAQEEAQTAAIVEAETAPTPDTAPEPAAAPAPAIEESAPVVAKVAKAKPAPSKAAPAPVSKPQPAPEPVYQAATITIPDVVLPSELENVAERLELNDLHRYELSQDKVLQACILDRLSDRRPLQVLRHRRSTDAYLSYLESCFL